MSNNIKSILNRIGALQLQYSSENTPAMQERGVLIRSDLCLELQKQMSLFKEHIPLFQSDLKIQGKDGVGRKTSAPWVRLYSNDLSPSATKGYYVVIHFSLNGKQCFVTVGCGASTWDQESGDFKLLSDHELSDKTKWARTICNETPDIYSLFPDEINLGGTASLVRSFEKATVCAKAINLEELIEDDFINIICNALQLLERIYDRHQQLSDTPNSKIDQELIHAVTSPARKNKKGGQGIGLSGVERKAVEMRAMKLVEEYLRLQDFEVEDCSANQPFDFLASQNGTSIKVEVKGTTSSNANSIMMTANEVSLHSDTKETTALAIVSNIRLVTRGENPSCDGGHLEYFENWDIDEWIVKPMAFQIFRP